MEFFTISLLYGVSYGLLLFMLSSGLTLIYSMMGVLNFAHASFYMLGAFFAFTVSQIVGFWPALFIAPLLVGVVCPCDDDCALIVDKLAIAHHA
jgi:branched-chain amino acid transport system permease protein